MNPHPQLNERLAQVEAGYALEKRGIRFYRDLNDSEWEALGRDIAIRLGGSQWHIGDWLVYGEGLGSYSFETEVVLLNKDVVPVAGRNHVLAYGGRRPISTSKYERAQILTGLSAGILSDYYRTSRAFDIEVRVDLSWTRHYDTLPLLPEDRLPLLRRCVTERWGSKEWIGIVAQQVRRNPAAAKIVKERQAKIKMVKVKKISDKFVRGVYCPHCHLFIEKAFLHTRGRATVERINKS